MVRWWLAFRDGGGKSDPPTDRSIQKLGGNRQNDREKALRPQKPEKTPKIGVYTPPPVLYQHLKIVRGLFLDLIFRPKKGLSGPQKTHGRPLAPEVKLVFVFSFSFFRLCGACFRRFLGVRGVRKSRRQNKGK